MTQLVLEIIDDGPRRYERVALGTAGCTVGRAWDCDVIVPDLKVDPQHLRLTLADDGALEVSDLQSLNGTTHRGKPLGAPAALSSGDELQLGKTRIVVHRADAPVPAAVSPTRFEQLRAKFEQPAWVFSGAALLVIVQMLVLYLSSTRELDPAGLITNAVTTLRGIAMWVIAWGLITRLLRGAMHWRAHLAIAVAISLAWAFLDFVTGWVGWQTLSVTAMQVVESIGASVLLFALGAMTLGVATKLGRGRLLALASLAPIVTLSASWVLPLLTDREAASWPELVSVSRPPGWTLASRVSLTDYLRDGAPMFETVAQDAKERAEELAATDTETR